MAPLSMGEKRRGNKTEGTLEHGSPQSNRMVWHTLRPDMKYMLVKTVAMSLSKGSDGKTKTVKMRRPQSSKAECLKSAKTFKFPIGSALSVDTHCEPEKLYKELEVKGI